jgi:hypothetical protein
MAGTPEPTSSRATTVVDESENTNGADSEASPIDELATDLGEDAEAVDWNALKEDDEITEKIQRESYAPTQGMSASDEIPVTFYFQFLLNAR